MLMSGHVIGHVILLLIDSGRGLSNGCVRLLQWLVWWCIQILNCTTIPYVGSCSFTARFLGPDFK